MNNEKLEINAGGLIGGKRDSKDGVVFFGKQFFIEDQIVNDYELNIEYPGEGNYIFFIYFKKSKINFSKFY